MGKMATIFFSMMTHILYLVCGTSPTLRLAREYEKTKNAGKAI
ncbi:hypothetical protein [Lactobacillus phage JNU_P9]|nr:hypothetical protein [Lactobacillus phage JNU_P9]